RIRPEQKPHGCKDAAFVHFVCCNKMLVIFSADLPLPNSGGHADGVFTVRAAFNMFAVFAPVKRFQPACTVSGHSVSSRSVKHGTPSIYASFCTPPESVSTSFAPDTSFSISK